MYVSKMIDLMCYSFLSAITRQHLGVAAGIHFAVSTPNVVFTDLDSDLFLFQDIKEPLFTSIPYLNGIRVPVEKPGLGIELNELILKKLATEKTLIYEDL
jgi:L-alanine-DL-glutamate epimerase-like enolase superfamily enzyme